MECRRRDATLVVRVTDEDLSRPVELHAAFEDLIFRDGERRIAVDLSEVLMLTSLMIGALVSLHLLSYENVVLLSFEGMHEKVLALFRLIGVDKLIEAHYPQETPGQAGTDA